MRRKDKSRRARPEPVAEAPELEVDAPGPGDGRVRLNKLLADHGIASRRKCDELIAAGKVSIDGEPVTELGTKVDPERQEIEVDGFVLRGAHRRYYLLDKPPGVVCTSETRETRPRAVDLITDRAKGRIYTVGRLDEDSEGLIILTNDGEFANRVMHPRYGIEKTYSVRVAGKIDDEALDKVRDGVRLSEGRTAGARIVVRRRSRDFSMLDVTIHEGMNREIRRAFARVGFKVVTLRRTRIGPIDGRGLKPGRWRALTPAEVDALIHGRPLEERRRGRKGRKGGSSARPGRPGRAARSGIRRRKSGPKMASGRR